MGRRGVPAHTRVCSAPTRSTSRCCVSARSPGSRWSTCLGSGFGLGLGLGLGLGPRLGLGLGLESGLLTLALSSNRCAREEGGCDYEAVPPPDGNPNPNPHPNP